MPESLADAAATGDRLKALEAARDRIARDLDLTTSARDVASLMARFTDVLEQIAELKPPTEEVDPLVSLVFDPTASAG